MARKKVVKLNQSVITENNTKKVYIGEDYYHVFDSSSLTEETDKKTLDEIFEGIDFSTDSGDIVLNTEEIEIKEDKVQKKNGVYVGVYSVHLSGAYSQGWMLNFFGDWFDKSTPDTSFTLLQSYDYVPDDKLSKILKKSSGSLNASDMSETNATKLSEQVGALGDLTADMGRNSEFYNGHLRLILKANSKENLEILISKLVKEILSNNTFKSGYKFAFNVPPVTPVFGQVTENISPILNRSANDFLEGGLQSSRTISGSTLFPMSFASSRRGLYLGTRNFDYMNEPVLEDFTDVEHLTVIGDMDSTNNIVDSIIQTNLIDGGKVEAISLHKNPYKGIDLKNAMTTIGTKEDPINIFEFFGNRKDSVEIYNSGSERILQSLLMFIKKNEISTSIETELNNILKNFYIQNHVWNENPDAMMNDLRVIVDEHETVDTFRDFIQYLAQQRQAANVNQFAGAKTLDDLYGVFSDVQSKLSSYMDKKTSYSLDEKLKAPFNLVDLANIMNADSKGGLATMIMSYISRLLAFDDTDNERYNHFTLVLYDCDFYDERITKWLDTYITKFNGRRRIDNLSPIKVVYQYNDIENAIKQKDFNKMMKNSFVSLARYFSEPILNEILEYRSFPEMLNERLVSISQIDKGNGYDDVHFLYLKGRATIFTEEVIVK
ncbi:hypothetical protein [Pseudolactococcus insecticola]|uniref:Uncharacterized protein n=1 Tax=Pseudolactococcus insecticola TaxID=2709158 RepID=A0A6A0B7K8_9LACT|nr:hypothetical protein [Lactococcus insecticola]GFH41272.1 hypothetical protein Hs20B_16700 [Lactococcus insecticola]